MCTIFTANFIGRNQQKIKIGGATVYRISLLPFTSFMIVSDNSRAVGKISDRYYTNFLIIPIIGNVLSLYSHVRFLSGYQAIPTKKI